MAIAELPSCLLPCSEQPGVTGLANFLAVCENGASRLQASVSVTCIRRSGCGIVARPIAAAGFGSKFTSELIGPRRCGGYAGSLKAQTSLVRSAICCVGWLEHIPRRVPALSFRVARSPELADDAGRDSRPAFSIGTSDDILQWFLEESRNSGRRSGCKPPTGAVHGDPQSETPGPQRSKRGNSHSSAILSAPDEEECCRWIKERGL